MAKKTKTASATDAEIAETTSRAERAAENQPRADLDMADFERRADRGDWLTIRDAADYMHANGAAGFDGDRGTQKIRNAIKNRAELAHAAGNVLYVGVKGYAIPPFAYVRRDALDTYRVAIENAPAVGRAGKNGAKRWIVRVPADKLEAVRAVLADSFGIALEVASTPKTKKSDAASDQPTPIEAAINAAESDQPAEIAAD